MMFAVTATVLPLYIGMSARQGVISAADGAALAAADVVIGIDPGVPCEVAATVAEANKALLVGCVVDGAVVTVSTNRTIFGLVLAAEASAGPPGSAVN
jgi:secretion/DNA translocation related TadE-like protein